MEDKLRRIGKDLNAEEVSKKVYPIKYPSIESKIISGEFLITEKIDGSNLSIGYVNGVLRIQSREQILHEPYKFCHLQDIVEHLIKIVEKMKSIMNCNFLIYGELFGHMKEIKYYDAESKNVFKSEKTFFRAFDLLDIDRNVFLKYTEAIKKFEQISLPYLPILDIQYETVSDLYKRVEIEKSAYSDNILEGFVLKTDEESHKKSMRKIFKIKREKFNGKGMLKKCKLQNYINKISFYSAYSKVGDDKQKIREKMIADTIKEVMPLFIDCVKEEVEKCVESHYYKVIQKTTNV